MYKSFKYRLYPTKQQEAALATMLETHRHLYNRALAERKDAWEQEQRSVTYNQQAAQLKHERVMNPYMTATNYGSCQATLRRLDRAFQAFFRRVKAGDTPGYPRFRGRNRFDSVEFPMYGDGCKLERNRVYFQHIGRVRVKLHRAIEGEIKTVSYLRKPDGWHVIFACDCGAEPPKRASAKVVGVDLGLSAFLVTSDRDAIMPPHFYKKAQRQVRRASRRVARRQKGSKRRAKAIQQLAKIHLHVSNQRRDFHHKTARQLLERYDTVVHEQLSIVGIGRSYLAKSTHDVAWGSFLEILHSKAVEAGCTVIAVPAKNTSQACSACGELPDQPKTLKDRIHACQRCGYTADRDHNAAQNIKRLGLSRQALTLPKGGVA